MKSPFVYPAVCAATLHVAFLVGFENPNCRDGDAPEPEPLWTTETLTLTLPPPPPEIVEVKGHAKTDKEKFEAKDLAPVVPADPVGPQPDAGNLRPIQPDIPSLEPVIIGQQMQPPRPAGPSGPHSGPGYPSVFSPDTLDKIPETRLRVPPHYPEAMRRIGAEAEVQVTFVVNTEGRVVEARADERAPLEFAREAEKALRRWRFEPGTRGGRPVSFRMSVPLIFAISTR